MKDWRNLKENRTNIQEAFILISDALNDPQVNLDYYISSIHNHGAKMFAFSIGNNVNANRLFQIVKFNKDSLFILNNYKTVIETILKLC